MLHGLPFHIHPNLPLTAAQHLALSASNRPAARGSRALHASQAPATPGRVEESKRAVFERCEAIAKMGADSGVQQLGRTDDGSRTSSAGSNVNVSDVRQLGARGPLRCLIYDRGPTGRTSLVVRIERNAAASRLECARALRCEAQRALPSNRAHQATRSPQRDRGHRAHSRADAEFDAPSRHARALTTSRTAPVRHTPSSLPRPAVTARSAC